MEEGAGSGSSSSSVSDSRSSSGSASEASSSYTSPRSEKGCGRSDGAAAKLSPPLGGVPPSTGSPNNHHQQQQQQQKRSDPNDQDDVRRGIEQMKEALELIPADQKAAYAEAVRRAPRLVEIESNLERYLKFEELNPWEAARKVVDYWTVRLELFGEGRAFLPLTLTGDGALSEEDMEVFRTGHMMILPRTVHGKPAIFHDRSRLDKAELLEPRKRLRCIFYFLSVLSEMSPSCVSLTVYCSKTRKSTFDLKMITDGISYFIVRRVIPVGFEQLHYVMLSTRPVLDFVIPTTLKALERVGRQKPNTVVVHSDHSVDSVQEALRNHGFSLEGLPKVPLGGLYTFGCFRRWVEDRIRIGARLYGAQGHGSVGPGDALDAKPAAAAAAAALAAEDPEEAATRKRREVYAGYARRKRARKRIEAKVLQSEVARLERQRDELERAGHDLESRLDRAERIVAAHEAGQQQSPTGGFVTAAAAGTRLSGSARGERLLKMQPLPPLPASSSSGGDGGGRLGMQHHHLSAMPSLAGLPGWYAATSPNPTQCYAPYQQPPQLLLAHGMAPSSSAPLYHGPRPIIFLDAATAAACTPVYVVGDPSSSYMTISNNSFNGGGGGGTGTMGHLSWSHVPVPARDPLPLETPFGYGGGRGAAAGAPPPPPPPPPSPS